MCILNFYKKNFVSKDEKAYTVAHDSLEFFKEAENYGKKYIYRNFLQDSNNLKKFFLRDGVNYDFGPSPFIWDKNVWEWLSAMLEEKGMTISDGIATDSTGRMWDTGSGATLRAATVVTPAPPIQGDTATVTSAPSSGSSNTGTTTDTRTVTMPLETTTAVIAVAIPAADEDLSTLDEIFPEEEIIDSIEAVVQSNGTTRIQVSTGYNLTALTVVATKKGSKKKN